MPAGSRTAGSWSGSSVIRIWHPPSRRWAWRSRRPSGWMCARLDLGPRRLGRRPTLAPHAIAADRLGSAAGGEARREARRVAAQAAAELELQDALGVARVLEQRERARVADLELDAPRLGARIDPHDPAALQDRPHAAGLIRAAVGALLILGLGAQLGAGGILGSQRGERLAPHSEELLYRQLRFRVSPLAVVVLVQASAAV